MTNNGIGNNLGLRAGKEEFMRALGLNPSDAHHEGHYRAMRDLVITVYNMLQADRNCLQEARRADPSVQPPFFWHHLSRERQQSAILTIWQSASIGSIARQLFDRGATNGEQAPNWVILWLLYSVFRSRDSRNNRNRRGGDDKSPDKDERSSKSSTSSASSSSRTIYDPVRDLSRT